MHFKDLFSNHSQDYAKFRPRYPRSLFEYLGSICSERKLAWDCGTGNGQAATELAERFDKVIATDPSEQQLKNAERHPRIEYRQATAENSGMDSTSANLITVAQAFHWFRHQEFFSEVERVLIPGGPMVLMSYNMCTILPEVDRLIMYLYDDVLGDRYWEPERKHVENEYRDIPIPFQELSTPKFTMTARWSLEQLIGYLGTWSALQKFIRANATNPLEDVYKPLKEAWGGETIREVSWPLSVRRFSVMHR
jgi:SAM-dependent methyltransferase